MIEGESVDTAKIVDADLIDLGDFNTTEAGNKGAEIELRHPVTNKPLGILFGILGKDSDEFRNHQREAVNSRIHREAAASRRGKDAEPRTAEEIEHDACEVLTVVTTHWRTVVRNAKGEELASVDTIKLNGRKLPFSPANAFDVYRTQLWVRRQIDEAVGDIANFMKG